MHWLGPLTHLESRYLLKCAPSSPNAATELLHLTVDLPFDVTGARERKGSTLPLKVPYFLGFRELRLTARVADLRSRRDRVSTRFTGHKMFYVQSCKWQLRYALNCLCR